MAQVKIDLSLQDQSSSIKKRTKDVQDLNKELEKSQQLTTGTKSGSRAVKSSFSAAGGGGEGAEYGRARGSMGATGASGRDFANQAQGLGGLVRLYATYAANLFATTAAFQALSNAMDTSNMIRGLDQIGVAGGANLVRLSKGLVDATDGAISLREAMTATAQAAASGMSDANIKRLGAAARGASAALGINMSDAISRLSRGITKLEPELLDELGIFVRVDKAAEEYARKLGKSTSQLTEFERSQAFANAVLDQTNKKFGEIDIPANPYDKLLASLKNVAQGGLEVVNKVLGPIALALSQSPTALATAIAAIAGLIVKQALPAIVQWKSALHSGAESAAASAKTNLELYRAYVDSNMQQAEARMSKHEQEVGKSAQAGMEKAIAAIKKGGRVYNSEFNKLLKKDPSEYTKADLSVVDKYQKEQTAKASKATGASTKDVNARARADAINAEADNLKKAINENIRYNDSVQKAAGGASMMGLVHERNAKMAGRNAARLTALANAADNATFSGPLAAWRSFNATANKLEFSLGGVGRALFKVKGFATIAGAAIGALAGAFGNIMAVIGIVTAAAGMFLSFLGKNGKEAAAASQALDELGESTLFLDKVLQSISKKDPLNAISLESLVARGKAVDTLADNMLSSIDKVEQEIKSRNWADTLINDLAGVIGRSTEDKLGKELASGLRSGLKALDQAGTGSIARLELGKILGVPDTSSVDEFAKAMQNADKQTQSLATKKLSDLTKQLSTGAQSAKAFLDSIVELNKQYDDYIKTLANESTASKLGVDSVKNLTDLTNVLKGDIEPAMQAVLKLIRDPKALRIFPQEQASQLIALVGPMQDLEKGYANVVSEIAKTEAELQNLKGTSAEVMDVRITTDISDLQIKLGMLKLDKESLKKQFTAIADSVNKSTAAAIVAQIDTVFRQVEVAKQKAALAAAKTYAEPLQGTRAGVQLQAAIDQRAVDLDIQQLKQGQALVSALTENTLAIKAATSKSDLTQSTIAIAAEEAKGSKGNPEVLAQLKKQRDSSLKSIAEIDTLNASRTTTGALGNISQATLKTLSPELQSALLPVISQAQNLNAQLSAKYGEKQQIAFKAALSELKIGEAEVNRDLTDKLAGINQQIEVFANIADPAERARRTSDLISQREQLEFQQKMLPYQTESNAAVIAASKFAPGTADRAKADAAVSEVTGKQAAASAAATAQQASENSLRNQKDLLASIDTTYARAAESAGMKYNTEGLMLDVQEQSLSAQATMLDIAAQRGVIDDDSYVARKNILAIDTVALQNAKALLDYENKREVALSAIDAEMDKAFARGDMSEVVRLEEKQQATIRFYEIEGQLISRSNAAKMEAIRITADGSGRTLAYTQAFENAFKGMEDAISNFTKTGKLNFSDMINSFLDDLLRYEIRQQRTMMFQGMGGASGMAKWLMGAMGFDTPGGYSGMSNTNSNAGTSTSILWPNALGNAFDHGVQAFAKGGMFTNSIVDSPTLFKFAKGTGLMGEAGPEAIMPLTRDNSGNLGVRAQGGGSNVEVVVNNYSTAKAETRETTDSRGNRRIEVVVGDMVAQEVTRTGSAAQTAFSSTYGTRPALARR